MERLHRGNVNSTTRKFFMPLLYISGCLLCFLLFVHFGNLEIRNFSPISTFQCNYAEACKSESQNAVGGSATSGKLFKGEKVFSFPVDDLKFKSFVQAPFVSPSHSAELGALACKRWSVVTTIFEPSEAVENQAKVNNWCLLIVGDKKGPPKYALHNAGNNALFLGALAQESLAQLFHMIKLLPWNHFGRKNVGYLYAILHGAKEIWDFDDDNGLLKNEMIELDDLNSENETNFLPIREAKDYSFPSFNPYPLMGAPSNPCWPRGLPLNHIKAPEVATVKLTPSKIAVSAVGIIQSLANHDPDLDAIYRLTQPLPFDFKSDGEDAALPVLVPRDTLSPYNAQATLHRYSALWSLLLPVTVHGRVSDIWRGYVAQRLGEDIGMHLVFSPPLVRQDRNSHNYIADLDSESPLYTRAGRLLEQLWEWPLTAPSLAGRIEQLWVHMYEHGYLGIDDVILCQAWLEALVAAGYKFPAITGTKEAVTKESAVAKADKVPTSGEDSSKSSGSGGGVGSNAGNADSASGTPQKALRA